MEINNTIATKIYQYAAMGKPVIVSEARLMKEFVEANKLGFSVHFGNVEEFCQSILNSDHHLKLLNILKVRQLQLRNNIHGKGLPWNFLITMIT